MIDPQSHYEQRVAEFEKAQPEPGGIVMLGASHIEWFPTGRLLPGLAISNQGIASDQLGLNGRGMLQRLGQVFNAAPTIVIFQGGGNDLGEHWRHQQPALKLIETMFAQVVEVLRQGLPDAQLIVTNCLPTRGDFDGLNPLVRDFNPLVAETAEKHGATLLDLHSRLVDPKGRLPETLTEDGLHLNDKGYDRWAEQLLPMLTVNT
jgi:lysophospholipase L1-like esterase